MMRHAFLIIGLLTFSGLLEAREIPQFLKDMGGCFSVRYNFVEDGQHDGFFEPVIEKAVISPEDDVIHIRRVLLVDGEEQKHWREEWREIDPADNIWEQTVYGPFEDFRYRCQGAWIDSSWRCNAPHSPKPRRDQARPYAYLDRENTLKVNSKRWIHMQNNSKRLNDDSLYAVELGWNQYDRIASVTGDDGKIECLAP